MINKKLNNPKLFKKSKKEQGPDRINRKQRARWSIQTQPCQ